MNNYIKFLLAIILQKKIVFCLFLHTCPALFQVTAFKDVYPQFGSLIYIVWFNGNIYTHSHFMSWNYVGLLEKNRKKITLTRTHSALIHHPKWNVLDNVKARKTISFISRFITHVHHLCSILSLPLTTLITLFSTFYNKLTSTFVFLWGCLASFNIIGSKSINLCRFCNFIFPQGSIISNFLYWFICW